MVKQGLSKSYLFKKSSLQTKRGILMSTKMITLVCYWDGVIVNCKEGIYYEGTTGNNLHKIPSDIPLVYGETISGDEL